MKTILRQEIPRNFTYYRTGSRVFYEYYKKYTYQVVQKIGKGYEFLTAMQIFPGFWSISVEKHDTEPSIERLRKDGVHHGIIFWTPLRRIDKPSGWIRMPVWFTKWQIHSPRSAFSVLDREDYWNKWSPNARAHRRHVLKNISSGTLRIENESIERFISLYNTIKTHDPNKRFVSRMTKKLFSETTSEYRVYIAYVDNIPLAGAVFIDEGTTSEYWASFYYDDSRPYHLGIAIMDKWFFDSYKKGIRYCDLDHMRDKWQSIGFSGYTKFKESIADHDAYFHDMWIKIF